MSYRTILGPAALALFAGYFMIPTALKAADSPEITKLLSDAKIEAIELKSDAADVESFTRSSSNWQSYSTRLEMVKEHINNTGKLLTKLKDAEATGSPWQRTAIKRIEPLLRELADNTTATIKHLDANKDKVHLPEFQDYVKTNYELATDLEALIRQFLDYGTAKEKFEESGSKLEIQN